MSSRVKARQKLSTASNTPNGAPSAGRMDFMGLEALESRLLLNGSAPALPGLVLVDPDTSAISSQLIYLDFDGQHDVTYCGPAIVGPFDVPAFSSPNSLRGQESQVIDAVLAVLRKQFASSDVRFTATRPSDHARYSTVYIGGDDSPFTDYGSFLGLAESVDVSNANGSDSAFVFSGDDHLQLLGTTEYVSALSALIAHESGHLLGYQHAYSSVPHSAVPWQPEPSPLDSVAHKTTTHQWILSQALTVLNSVSPDLWDYSYFQVTGTPGEAVSGGSYGLALWDAVWNEDTQSAPWGGDMWNGYLSPFREHFFDPDSSDASDHLDTIWGIDINPDNESALDRAELYTPYIDNAYTTSTVTEAWGYLGRIAHLVADMTVPAHVHLDPHGNLSNIGLAVGDDNYEDYMIEVNDDNGSQPNYELWDAADISGLLPSFETLDALFRTVAEVTDDYDSDNVDGEFSGSADINIGEVDYSYCRLYGNTLMPNAFKYTASLLAMFISDVRPTLVGTAPSSASTTAHVAVQPTGWRSGTIRIDRVDFQLSSDGSSWSNVGTDYDGTDGWTHDISVSDYPNGSTVYIRARAMDHGGLYSEWANWTVAIVGTGSSRLSDNIIVNGDFESTANLRNTITPDGVLPHKFSQSYDLGNWIAFWGPPNIPGGLGGFSLYNNPRNFVETGGDTQSTGNLGNFNRSVDPLSSSNHILEADMFRGRSTQWIAAPANQVPGPFEFSFDLLMEDNYSFDSWGRIYLYGMNYLPPDDVTFFRNPTPGAPAAMQPLEPDYNPDDGELLFYTTYGKWIDGLTDGNDPPFQYFGSWQHYDTAAYVEDANGNPIEADGTPDYKWSGSHEVKTELTETYPYYVVVIAPVVYDESDPYFWLYEGKITDGLVFGLDNIELRVSQTEMTDNIIVNGGFESTTNLRNTTTPDGVLPHKFSQNYDLGNWIAFWGPPNNPGGLGGFSLYNNPRNLAETGGDGTMPGSNLGNFNRSVDPNYASNHIMEAVMFRPSMAQWVAAPANHVPGPMQFSFDFMMQNNYPYDSWGQIFVFGMNYLPPDNVTFFRSPTPGAPAAMNPLDPISNPDDGAILFYTTYGKWIDGSTDGIDPPFEYFDTWQHYDTTEYLENTDGEPIEPDGTPDYKWWGSHEVKTELTQTYPYYVVVVAPVVYDESDPYFWIYGGRITDGFVFGFDNIELKVAVGDIRDPFARGDVNLDGAVNVQDINPFVQCLGSESAYLTYLAGRLATLGIDAGELATVYNEVDLNADGTINVQDINPFIARLSVGGEIQLVTQPERDADSTSLLTLDVTVDAIVQPAGLAVITSEPVESDAQPAELRNLAFAVEAPLSSRAAHRPWWAPRRGMFDELDNSARLLDEWAAMFAMAD